MEHYQLLKYAHLIPAVLLLAGPATAQNAGIAPGAPDSMSFGQGRRTDAFGNFPAVTEVGKPTQGKGRNDGTHRLSAAS